MPIKARRIISGDYGAVGVAPGAEINGGDSFDSAIVMAVGVPAAVVTVEGEAGGSWGTYVSGAIPASGGLALILDPTLSRMRVSVSAGTLTSLHVEWIRTVG